MGFMHTFRNIFNPNNLSDIKLTEPQSKLLRVMNKRKNIILLSPCGSGKTEASYLLTKKWNKKTTYVLPMKTLATAIQTRLNMYESSLESGAKWSIQHSSASEDTFLDSDYSVTTIDQVLSGYLGIGRQSFIRGKNVMKSNFIFDEIQLLETNKTLKTLLCMLDSIHGNGNQFIIMTATMPKYLMEFMANRYNAEIIEVEKPVIQNRNVYISYQESVGYETIESFNEKQIIICNTQKEQIEVYEKIANKDRVILLNNKLQHKDREFAEEAVMKYFGKSSTPNNKILISTQIIEAGMDISAPKVYSSLCSIDSLIQREGRVARWGGNGYLTVFSGHYKGIYDEEVVVKTKNKLLSNQGICFSWQLQKQWVDEIMSPYYKQFINEKSLMKHKRAMKKGSRNDLIRAIQNVNLIVDNEVTENSFLKESISISLTSLQKLAKTNKLYRLSGGTFGIVEEINCHSVKIGDTLVIQGFNSFYDSCGFRIEDGLNCISFEESQKKKENLKYEDYIEETWIEHSSEIKKVMKTTLTKDRFIQKRKDIERYSIIAGLHDLGKLTTVWQRYIGSKGTPLAHMPFQPRKFGLIRGVKHNIVSALALRDNISKLEFNLILQHHGRFMPSGSIHRINSYQLIETAPQLLKEIGWKENIVIQSNSGEITDAHLLTPGDNEWPLFVYLLGTLMQSDIQSIQNVKHRKAHLF
ncbi:CRISPR-associated helicase Cas3' [Bacillus thuringiensis]|uniref:CRISPR-associated helicase Cas3' n=1 Tax=Bacillus thuringiensis TaxID=1428 RepID=UPI0011A24EAE|nr:CRISPR-associated helicase Cas3' [Bacillus thuringiensis]